MQINGASQAKTQQVHGPQGLSGPHFGRNTPASQGAATAPDSVEISPEAQEAARLAEAAEGRAADAPIRNELVARIRSEIADGSYETPEKIDAALDRLLDEIG